MKNKTQLSIRAKLLFYVVFIVFLTQSCVGMVRHKDMELISKIDNQQILNLRAYKSMSLAFFRQGEIVEKNMDIMLLNIILSEKMQVLT